MTDALAGYRDRLEGYPGLSPMPHPESPEMGAIIADLDRALWDADGHGVAALEGCILRFMLRRGYWPLGTTVKIHVSGAQEIKFPVPPELRRAGRRYA